MQRFVSLIFLLILFSCKKQEAVVIKENKDTIEYESTNWQEGFRLIHSIDLDSVWGKPMRYYITNKNCDPVARDFYLGVYRPKDEPKTARLLSLVTTDNDSLRPFYRWILDKTIFIQDGTLGEYTGLPARKYAEKYPKEFFEYMDFDESGKKYSDWCNSILYSGLNDFENSNNTEEIKQSLIKTMPQNCNHCNANYEKRIVKFAGDCFSNENITK
jgi:hypothetical protein